MSADVRFLHDLICILLLSFACGYAASFCNMPPFFGYVIAGCILGPSGFNVVRAVIQMEALAQFGVMFIIFVLGIEFSFEQVSQIWRIAVGGTLSILAMSISLSCILGAVMGQSAIGEAIFVGSCVSLSSTAVVVKSAKSDDADIMYGILVMQDLLLGLMLAILPAVEKSGPDVIRTVGSHLFSLASLTVLILVVLPVPIAAFLHQVKQSGQHELFLLAVLCVCLLTLTLTEFDGLGMELGCFLAGMAVSSSSPPVARAALAAMEPIRDLFLCLFFAAIGMHVYPSFLVNEMLLVLTLAASAIGFKWVITTTVLMAFRFDFARASAMALGLSQISEFAFVLCSRAKALRIISREVYYLLLATSSITILATPVLLRTVFKPSRNYLSMAASPALGACGPRRLAHKLHTSDTESSQKKRSALTRANQSFAKLLKWLPFASVLLSDRFCGSSDDDILVRMPDTEQTYQELL